MSELFKRVIASFVAIAFLSTSVFAGSSTNSGSSKSSEKESTEPLPYTKEEFPQWAHDLRRTEIITFGSLPFVLLQSTIVYSFWRYYDNDYSSSYFPNPLSKTSEGAGLDSDEQKMLLATSAAISLGLGLTDLAIQIIKRHSKKRKERRLKQKAEENINIEPIEEPDFEFEE